ncbi:hypothetical protein SPV3_ORF17 [Sulfolobus polyhedral virus 3]|nr:hypothetical protein SPV3_ORF17 [Sulfolobus polyhedral virus 3]
MIRYRHLPLVSLYPPLSCSYPLVSRRFLASLLLSRPRTIAIASYPFFSPLYLAQTSFSKNTTSMNLLLLTLAHTLLASPFRNVNRSDIGSSISTSNPRSSGLFNTLTRNLILLYLLPSLLDLSTSPRYSEKTTSRESPGFRESLTLS